MSIDRRRIKRTTLITCWSLLFISGLYLGKIGLSVNWAVCLVCAMFFVVSRRNGRWITLLAVCLFGLACGAYRGSAFAQKLKPYGQLYGKEVVVDVRAETDGVYEDGQLSFDASSLHFAEPMDLSLPGYMKVKGRGVNSVFRGDVLSVQGKLYASRGSKQSGVSFAQLELVGHNLSFADKIRLRFAAGMRNSLPEPVASFGLGLLMGQRTSLPESVLNDLSIVGLTHIIAVSGYNLTIIMDVIRRRFSGLSKYQIAVTSVVLMSLFVLMTGFSASIVRASLVSVIGLMTWYHGRTIKPWVLLALAAALTAGWYPLYLWSDIGWWLSFLAFFGVLVLAPLIMQLYERSGHRINVINSVVIESVCAQVMTIPIIMMIFQRISLIGIVSNVLVVPLVPLAMLLTLISGLAGVLLPIISGLIGWPAKILLSYMLDLAHLLAMVPNAQVERSLSLVGALVCYLVLLVFCILLWRRVRKLAIIDGIKLENQD